MEIRTTNDGSQTIWSEQFRETYHSTFGAITESIHVFIEAGLKQCNANPINVFEMGFGTGLNTVLTYKEALAQKLNVTYHAIELYPVSFEISQKLELEPSLKEIFQKIHEAEWNKEYFLSQNFTLNKIQGNLNQWLPDILYDLIYFDAFSPETQPELWTQEVFSKMYNMLNRGGILTTYCAKGSVRRNMIASGFKVERMPGPPGKREMIRARKD